MDIEHSNVTGLKAWHLWKMGTERARERGKKFGDDRDECGTNVQTSSIEGAIGSDLGGSRIRSIIVFMNR